MTTNAPSSPRRFVWTYRMGQDLHGGMKAWRDTLALLDRSGAWRRFDTSMGRWKLLRPFQLLRYALRLMTLPRDSVFFVQYPLLYESRMQHLLATLIGRRFKIALFLHDLIELRDEPEVAAHPLLERPSYIISTGRLREWLPALADCPGSVLRLWDYLVTRPFQIAPWSENGPVLFAGSLWPKKVSWIYRADTGRPNLLIYGAGYDHDRNPMIGDMVIGPFDPDCPRFDQPAGWGLVWDGAKADSNEAETEYERFNQPHKVSLYLTCGLPLIVWRGGQMAEWVMEQGCGVTIDSLADISTVIANVSPLKHRQMREKALALGQPLRHGQNFYAALSELGLMTAPAAATPTTQTQIRPLRRLRPA